MLPAPLVRVVRAAGGIGACALLASTALAIQPTNDEKAFRLANGFTWTDDEAQPSLVMYEAGRADVPAEMSRFLGEQGGRWEVRWDARSERPHLVQGSGIPLLPGSGNRLSRAAAGINGARAQVEDVERLVRAFMARY